MTSKFISKYKNESIKDVETNDENQIICPHCKQSIKNKELKMGKDNKSIIHGKCEGKLYFTNELDLELNEDLFETKAYFIKGKMTRILAKAIRDLDLTDVGSIGQTPDKKSDYVSATPVKNAKQGKNKKIFTPPKQNR